MPAGGYQAPSSPAPVSGPGALSKRTDGGPAAKQPIRELPDANYGEGKAFRQEQQAAPLAATPGPNVRKASGGQPPQASQTVPFGAPTQNPSEPVTAGAALGPGPGPEALGNIGGQPYTIVDLLQGLQPSDATGGVAALLAEAYRRGA